jgi:hypothetical protein
MNISDYAVAYEAATADFVALASSVPADLLDAHAPGEWSARQIIHHMADSESQSYARLRRLIAEPAGSVIQGYDEAGWAECETLGYTTLPVENSLNIVRAVRAASLDIIRRLDIEDLDAFGIHSESGKYSVRMWLDNYVDHPISHGKQLVAAIASD